MRRIKTKTLTMKDNNKTNPDIERARLFLQHQKKYMDIHDATGLGYFWLQRFATGKIKDPRASLLSRLLDYIDEKAVVLPEWFTDIGDLDFPSIRKTESDE